MKRSRIVFGALGVASLLVGTMLFRMATAAPADEFVMTWKTDNAGTSSSTSIGIPLAPSTAYNFQIDWNNDGVFDQTYNATTPATPATYVTHNYGVAGTYTVRIAGTFPRIYFNNTGDRLKLLRVDQWGTISWRSMNSAFWGCANLRIPATDAPNLSLVVDFSQIFNGATSLNDSLDHWNVSTINNMTNAFNGASSFNQPLNNWNVSNVANMAQMFANATAFNQDITSWNTGNVVTMLNMFVSATNFNNGQAPGASTAPLTWNTSQVTSLQSMFQNATSFNQPIGSWDTSKVTSMYGTFQGATRFNQPLATWSTSAVTNVSYMFAGATKFNQPLNTWNIGNVLNMTAMFQGATVFNQPLNLWNTTKVTNMSSVFQNATAFNNGLASGVSGSMPWNTAAVTNTQYMFQGATSFNQPIGAWSMGANTNMQGMFQGATVFNNGLAAGVSGPMAWNTANVTTMRTMFQGASAFNQEIGSWNTVNVTNMALMFQSAIRFNQAIGSWNTAKVIDMQSMFQGATVFNNGLAAGVSGAMAWNTGLVANMQYMFSAATAFNQDISTWNVSNVTNMMRMLSYLPYFNQPIGVWNTAKLTDINNMFHTSTSFNQPLGNWNVTGVTNAINFLVSVKLSTANYDNLLINWNAQAVKTGVTFHGGASQYCAGAAARANLISVKTWVFTTDGGQNCAPTDIGLSNTSVVENTSAVGILSSVDPDAGNTFTYSLVAGAGDEDNGKFSIDNMTKALSFVTAPNFESPTDLGDTAGNNTYSVRIRTTDNLGGTFEKVFVITVTDVDEIPPTITITAPTKLKNATITNTTFSVTDATGVNATDVTIAPSGSTAGTSGLVCIQTTAKQVDCTINITSSGDLNIQAKDTLGNTGTKKELSYIVDATPPAFTTSSVDVTTNGINKPILTFAATDNIAVDHYEIIYVADNSGAGVSGSTTTMNPANSPATLTLDPDESVHTVTIRVYDTAGNYTDHVVKFPPIVNFTAPTTLSKSTITDSTVTITSPGGNDLTAITLSAGTTGATLGTCTGAGNDTTDPYANPVTCVIQNVASTGTVTVNAKDSVTGAVGQNSQSYIIDTTAPVITITAPTKLKNANITDTTITVTDNVSILAASVTRDAATTAGTSNFSCVQTTATRVDCTVTITSSGDLKIAASDKATNSTSKTETNYVIDTVSPVVTVASLPVINAANQAAYHIGGTCTDGDGDVTVLVNNTSHIAPCSNGVWSITVDVSGLADGSNVLSVVAHQTDSANNTTTTPEKQASKDATAPNVALTPILSNNTSPALSGTVDDPTAIVSVTINGVTYTATNNGDGTWSLPGGVISPALAHGIYDVSVTVTDAAGNSATDTTTNELTIDTTAPTATFTYSTTAPTNQPVTITMTVDEPISTPAGWTKVSDTVYTKTVSANTTSSDNTVTITDSAGNSSTIPFSVTNIDTTAPQGAVTPLVTTNTSPALTGTVDTDATTVDVVINGTTYHAVVSGGTWSLPADSIAPALTVGTYNIDVIATDGVGNTSTQTTTNALTILSNTAPLTNHSPNQGTDPAVNNATIAVTGGTCQSGFYDYKSLSPAGVSAPQANVTIIGGLTYRLSCGVLGGSTTVDVSLGTFYSNLSLLKIYKQIDGKMVDITGQVNLRNTGGKTLFTISSVDGATNDDDNQQNKEIIDPLYIGIIDPDATLTNTGEDMFAILFVSIGLISVALALRQRLIQ